MAVPSDRTIQLVLHYDGAGFSGWQRQRNQRTVQEVVEDALERLCGRPVTAFGSGRTDAGVHARGQAVGVSVPARWEPSDLRRAMNALFPPDVWVARADEMRPEFHARYSALSRRYRYVIGTDTESRSPFRRAHELTVAYTLDREALDAAATLIVGEHCFLGFAVRGTAPERHEYRCLVHEAQWIDRECQKGVVFEIEANRFLHHMVRFLVGTMLGVATGQRSIDDIVGLLGATDNGEVSPPAPAHALFLERVTYPSDLYLTP